MSDIDKIIDGVDKYYTKYIPERDYRSTDYKPFRQPFFDLCKHCVNYYDMIKSRGLTSSLFPPVCKGHVLGEYSNLLPTDFAAPEEYQEVLINSDPVAWAFAKFGWEPYWYQKELLDCTSKKKVVRAGRRTGKTATIVMLVLWQLFTKKNWNVLVIAPYQAQVTKIFDEMERMLRSSNELWDGIKRKTKSPTQRIELHNGSMVLGFSSGAKSATKSDKIRGQDSNFIVLDEADYLDDADLDAILAIMASHPDCGLWASSTPTGRHAKFYQFCIDKNLGFKEFWFIAHESPRWSDDAERFFKSIYNATTYEHELYAEFGLQEGGIFRNDLIDNSLVAYALPCKRSSPQSRVVMGVDWNGDKNGVHIVITEFWGGKYKVINKTIVRNDQFTQHAAIEEILRLDQEYACDFIYVDEGYGRVQIEMLHKMGMQNPATGLHKRVVAYAFNKPIEMRDPRTGVVIKKPSKPFLVNISALQLEANRLILPHCEDTQILVNTKDNEVNNKSTGLVQQMRNFAVERISVLGLPTYSQGDDHTLFAYMLSLTGFILEFSDLRRTNLDFGGATVQNQTLSPLSSQKDGTHKHLSSVVRQLDAGLSSSMTARDIGSIWKAKSFLDKYKKAIEGGDKRAINKHFDIRNIKRGQSLDDDVNRKRL